MNPQNIRDNQIMGTKGTYRKVFKPNLGGLSSNATDRNKQGTGDSMGMDSYQGHNKPPSRPPLNSRLKQKITQRNNGGYDETGEDQVEYEPTKRTGSLRSSRVKEPGFPSRGGMNKPTHEVGNNVPRASKAPKRPAGGMPKKSKPSNGYGRPPVRNEPDPAASMKPKVGSTSYPVEFGEDAYEQPTDLRPCPS